jgi:peroxiredoxin
MKNLLVIAMLFLGLSAMAQRDKSSVMVGDKAPVFMAKDQNGKTVKSKDILKHDQLIVVFYRGQWCPYCNKHLMHLQENVEKFAKAGAKLVAVSPELPVNVDKTVEKSHVDYPVLYDKDSKIMKQFGVEFMLPVNLQKRYKKYGVDLEVAHGNNDQLLPVPATYVIGKDGKVKYVHYDPQYKNRSTAKDILMHL